MKIHRTLFVAILAITALGACQKDAGNGGVAAIKGKVVKDVRLVLSNPASFRYTAPAADEDVYIIYGDHVSADDRIQTNYNGEFEFLYLRPGKYKIYCYSKDTTGSATVDPNKMVVLKEVEITDKKSTPDAGTFQIYDQP